MTTEKKQRYLTPIGAAKWAHVHVPKAAFIDKDGRSKGDPKYQIDVCFEADDPVWKPWAASLMAEVKALPEQTDKRTGSIMPKQIPIKKELDQDDKPTGRFYCSFKTNAKFKPGVFDRFGMVIPEHILVGNDSKVRIAYTKVPYEAFGGGIALYLNAVQVVELVEYQSQSAAGYGFETDALPSQTGGAAEMPDDIPF